jgi:hypothetical protein
MAKRRRKATFIPMAVGNDPSLWRFASLQEAVGVSTPHLAQLLREGEQLANEGEASSVVSQTRLQTDDSYPEAGD